MCPKPSSIKSGPLVEPTDAERDATPELSIIDRANYKYASATDKNIKAEN